MNKYILRIAAVVAVVSLVVFGLVGCGSSDSAGGDVQKVAVSANGVFEPYPVRVKAGLPVELDFGQGSGCTLAVNIAQFGVSEDLTNGGAVVKLPALEAGTYDLICQSNMVMGQIVAE